MLIKSGTFNGIGWYAAVCVAIGGATPEARLRIRNSCHASGTSNAGIWLGTGTGTGAETAGETAEEVAEEIADEN